MCIDFVVYSFIWLFGFSVIRLFVYSVIRLYVYFVCIKSKRLYWTFVYQKRENLLSINYGIDILRMCFKCLRYWFFFALSIITNIDFKFQNNLYQYIFVYPYGIRTQFLYTYKVYENEFLVHLYCIRKSDNVLVNSRVCKVVHHNRMFKPKAFRLKLKLL